MPTNESKREKQPCRIGLSGAEAGHHGLADIVFYPFKPAGPGILPAVDFWFGSCDVAADEPTVRDFLGNRLVIILGLDTPGEATIGHALAVETQTRDDCHVVFFIGLEPFKPMPMLPPDAGSAEPEGK